MPGFVRLLPLLALGGCTDSDLLDTGWADGGPPDVTGSYNVIVEGASGCEGQYGYVTDWAEGPLTISGGGPADLTFDFGQDMAFSGSVDSSWSYSFSGFATWDGADLSIFHAGLFYPEDGRYEMGGDFELDVVDSEFVTDTCSLEARISAYQL